MDGKLVCGMDKRKSANGLFVGQRVRLKLGGQEGEIIGFGSAFHSGSTVFTKLDNAPGNQGTYHTCGNSWVEVIEDHK